MHSGRTENAIRSSSGARSRRSAVVALLVGVLAVSLLATHASAVIPNAGRVAAAAVKKNKAAGRTQALRLEVVMRDAEGEPIGRGSLVTHPSGLARLELRGAYGLIERHILQGAEHLAARNGERLESPQAFLPPLFLLQTDSLLALQAGLGGLGADAGSIGLSGCGDSDCYVIGDPRRVAPEFKAPIPQLPTEEELPVIKELLDGEPFIAATIEVADPLLELETGDPLLLEGPFASLWVDIVTYETKRIDLRSGVVVWLGPSRAFERVQMPAWFRLDEPGRSEILFDVLEVAPVNAPAAAFSKTWLYAPVASPSAGGEAPGAAPGDATDIPPGPLSR